MAFLHPLIFAAGLAAISIPILIHLLLRRKRKPVKWAAMRFLLEAHKKRYRRRKLEQIILLLARCLLVAVLAAAIARPIFDGDSRSKSTTLVVVIDNSLSSSIVDQLGRSALDRHKETAIEQLEQLLPARGDRAAVIAAAGPAYATVSPATLDLDAARHQINQIEPTDSAIDLPRSLSLAADAIPPEAASARIVLIGDWRRGAVLDEPAITPADAVFPVDDLEIIVTPPAQDDPPNLRITSFVPGRGAVFPDDTPSAGQALITVQREGATLPQVQATLVIEAIGDTSRSSQRRERPITLPPGERTVTIPADLPLPGSGGAGGAGGGGGDSSDLALRAEVRAGVDDDRIARDSTAWTTIRLRESARVGLIHARQASRALNGYAPADWVRIALRPDPAAPVQIRELDAAGLTHADLAGLDAAVLTRPDLLTDDAWSAIGRFVGQGSTLILFPPVSRTVHRWPDQMRSALSIEVGFSREAIPHDPSAALVPGGLAGAFPMLSGDLETLAGNVAVSAMLEADIPGERIVLEAEGGGAFLFSPAARIWIFASALDSTWTDLPAKPLFLPLMQEMARQSVAPLRPATVLAGELPIVAAGVIELINHDTGRRLARSIDTGAIPAVREAGAWLRRNARGEPMGLIAVTPDHRAGRTGPTPAEEVLEALRQAIPGVGPTLLQATDEPKRKADLSPDRGANWVPFLIAAGLALLELVAARAASHAHTPRGDSP